MSKEEIIKEEEEYTIRYFYGMHEEIKSLINVEKIEAIKIAFYDELQVLKHILKDLWGLEFQDNTGDKNE